MNASHTQPKVPTWFWILAALGLLWNVFGVFQFAQSVMATKESLIAMGMTDAQAELMKTYPLWMTIAFAVGTVGGLIGSGLLLLRKKMASTVFAISLVGYIILYIGDITEGVFEAMGTSQVVILTMVVFVAAGLLWMSRTFERKRSLT